MPTIDSHVMDLTTLFNKESIIENRLKSNKIRIKNLEDKIILNTNVLAATNTFKNYSNSIESNLLPLIYDSTALQGSVFNRRSSNVTTTDTNGVDYVSVTVDANASLASFDVEVQQLATSAQVIGNQVTSDFTAPASYDINIQINGLPDVDVAIPQGSDLTTIKDLVNVQGASSDIEALILKSTVNDENTLVIRNTNVGVRQIIITEGVNDTLFANAEINRTDSGLNSQIKAMKSVTIETASNRVEDIIPGITLDLKKTNAVNQTQNIQIIQDASSIETQINNWINSINNFLEFAAIQSERDTINPELGFKDGAYLGQANSNSLLHVSNAIINTITTSVAGLKLQGIQSLPDIGIKMIELNATDELPRRKALSIDNPTLFSNAIANDPGKIQKLLQITTDITANPANDNSTLSLLSNDNILPNSVLATAIEIKIDFANGTPGRAEFSLDAGIEWHDAMLLGNVITFDDTVLEGITLYFDPKSAITDQQFTITITQGLASMTHLRLADGVKMIEKELIKLDTDQESLNKQLIEEQDILDKKAKALDKQFIMLEFIEMQSKLSSYMIDQLLVGIK